MVLVARLKLRKSLSAITVALVSVWISGAIVDEATASGNRQKNVLVNGKSSLRAGAKVDRKISAFMVRNGISAGQLSIIRADKLIYEKAFGFRDEEHLTPTLPSTRFRIASCSKMITAVAVLSLVEGGKLSLDDHVIDILSELKPADDRDFDQRFSQITVRNLLEHNAGFSNKNGDPQCSYLRSAASHFGRVAPSSAEDIVRYRFLRPLDNAPGTVYEYSNFGYNVLGRIIERKSGMSYESFVQEALLKPLGISAMCLGKTRASDRSTNEVFYDDGNLGDSGWSIFPDESGLVSKSYGSIFSVEAMDAHGGWLSNATDLCKFMSALSNSEAGPKLLKSETFRLMTEPPLVADKNRLNVGTYYAKGLRVYVDGSELNHSGALTWGTSSFVCHFANGVSIACLFNHLPGNTTRFFQDFHSLLLSIARKDS